MSTRRPQRRDYPLTMAAIFATVLVVASALVAWRFDRNIAALYNEVGPWTYVLEGVHYDLYPALAGCLAIWIALAPVQRVRLPLPQSGVLGLGLAVFAVAAALRFLLFGNFDLFVDEWMAGLQADMFRAGDLMAPIPDELRPIIGALHPYMANYDIGNGYWGVFYLPVFGALRALADLVADDGFLNPLMAAVSVGAIASVAERLWPGERSLRLLAALLLASSPQFLLTAATGFSFSAHLAFNLIWLRLVLAGSNRAHLAAALLGFMLVGLHRPHVHLLFAFPFVAAFVFGWQRRSIRTAFGYGAAYAAGLVIWLGWADWSNAVAIGDWSAMPWNPLEFRALQRYADLATVRHGLFESFYRYPLMILNVMRLSAWLNPAVLVLAVAGAFAWRRLSTDEKLVALSIASSILPYTYLMANPSIGWGYRFAVPALGSMALLAVSGWRAIGSGTGARAGFVALASAYTLVVQYPVKLWQMDGQYRPNIEIARQLAARTEAIVPVDHFAFRHYHIRNGAYLEKRPLIVAFPYLFDGRIPALCGMGQPLTVVSAGSFEDLGIEDRSRRVASLRTSNAALAEELRAAGCRLDATALRPPG